MSLKKNNGEENKIDHIRVSRDRERIRRIKELPGVQLIHEFETLIRNGAGHGYRDLVWITNEILARLKKITVKEVLKETKREKLAEYAHETWSGWMRYLFSASNLQDDGRVFISRHFVERWTRQMNTKYKDLSLKEKESDLEEADEILTVCEERIK